MRRTYLEFKRWKSIQHNTGLIKPSCGRKVHNIIKKLAHLCFANSLFISPTSVLREVGTDKSVWRDNRQNAAQKLQCTIDLIFSAMSSINFFMSQNFLGVHYNQSVLVTGSIPLQSSLTLLVPISTYKFSRLIYIYFFKELVERICL